MTSYDLSGRSALITGASLGLGFAIARRFCASGADLFLCARGIDRLEKSVSELEKLKTRADQKILYRQADVSKADEVKDLVSDALKAFPNLTALVSNAGVYGPKGKIEEVSLEEFWGAIEINLLGPILLSRELIPHFRMQNYGKIIQISGGGATNPMPRLESYATSKAAVVRLMESLALDLQRSRVDVNSISPGLLDTRLLDEVLAAGPQKVGEQFYSRMKSAKEEGSSTDPEIGAKLCEFLASSASDGITGKLISAVWDDYTKWPEHLSELTGKDLYTLRRITGRDRQINWGDK
ncbi:MAG: SDR family oxidoreductase [Deltaproteobacteria bacterium]|nr:SDR family oxidoreductase [Deltaproteobacteria bacterium]